MVAHITTMDPGMEIGAANPTTMGEGEMERR
jgi:membrane-bound ClpP family serine protease